MWARDYRGAFQIENSTQSLTHRVVYGFSESSPQEEEALEQSPNEEKEVQEDSTAQVGQQLGWLRQKGVSTDEHREERWVSRCRER